MAGTVVARDTGAIEDERHAALVQRHVEQHLVECAVDEGRINCDDGMQAAHREAGGTRDGVLLSDADVEHAVGELVGERVEPHRVEHCGGDRDDIRTLVGDADDLIAEDRRPAGRCDVDRLAGGPVERVGLVHLVVLVGDRDVIALALDR